MNILITGGSGFIGTRVVRKLLEQGEKVVAGDIQAPRQLGAEEAKFTSMDVRQLSDVSKVVHDFKVHKIVHLAYIGPPPSEKFPYTAMEINCLGTANIFEAARLFGIKRVVFPSSIAVYATQGFYGGRPVTEDDVPNPPLLYGANKVLNERVAARYEEEYGIEIPALRIASVCGVGRVMGISAWIGQIPALAKGGTVLAPMRSDERIAIINVDDVADLLVKLCLAKKLKHRIYNSGAHTLSGKEITDIVKKRFPNAVIKFDENAPDVPMNYRQDNSRIAAEFGWKLSDVQTTLFGQME